MKAIVLEGGAMLGSFGFGVLTRLSELGIFPQQFQIFIGTSAGYFDLAYALCQQWEAGWNMWVKLLPNGFVVPGVIPRFDLGYLETTLRDSKDAVCFDRIKSLEEKIWLPVTNLVTGKPDFHILNDYHDPLHLMLAGCKMPWEKRGFVVNGYPVCDGGLVCHSPVNHASSLGAAEIWVVSPNPIGYRAPCVLQTLFSPLLGSCRASRELVRSAPSRDNRLRRVIEGRRDIKIICPKNPLEIDWRTTDSLAIARTIEFGKSAASRFVSQLSAL